MFLFLMVETSPYMCVSYKWKPSHELVEKKNSKNEMKEEGNC